MIEWCSVKTTKDVLELLQKVKWHKIYTLSLHNGIRGTVKRKVYQQVLSDHLVVRYAVEANSIYDIWGIFITIPYSFMVRNDSIHKCVVWILVQCSYKICKGHSIMCLSFVITLFKYSFLWIGVLLMPNA